MRHARRGIHVLLALGLIFVAAGCSDDSNGTQTPDKGPTVTPDSGTKPTPPDKVECAAGKSDCKEFVMTKILLPLTSDDIKKYGFSYKGQPKNKLGEILVFMATTMKFTDIQPGMDGAVNQGLTLILQRLKAKDFANDPAAVGQAWIAKDEACCTDRQQVEQCATEAKQSCFNGTKEFTPDPSGPNNATYIGAITGGNMNMYAPSLQLRISIMDVALDLTLKEVTLKGTLGKEGTLDAIKDGILSGAIPDEQVQTTLMTKIAEMLTMTMNDATTTESTKTLLKAFDTDSNNVISGDEFKAKIGAVVSPDLDLVADANNKPDHLSIGVGFSSLQAVVKAQ